MWSSGLKVKAGDKMSLFKRRKKIANEVETPTEQATEETAATTEQEQPVGVVTLQQLNEFFNKQGFSSALAKNNLNAATYYACMLIRCNSLAKVPFKVYEYDGDGAKETQHHLNRLLKLRPNRFMTAHDFLWASEFQRLSTGNNFWVYRFNRGKIEEIYLLDSNYVEIIVDNAGILSSPNSVYYLYTDPRSSRQTIYTSDRIVHHKYFSTDGIKGNSIQKYLVDVLSQEKYAQQVVNEKYSHGLQDPIIVTYTGDLDKVRSAQIKKKFANLGGAHNAGNVIPIPTDFGVQQLETKLVNSQFFELNGLTTRHIANAFGVKSFQLNDMEKSTYSNIEQQNRAFYSDTMQNVLTAFEQEATYKLLSTEEQEKLFIKANADVYLRADIEARYKAYQTGITGGFLQIAEARKRENLPFIPGTDKLIIGNGAAIPLDMLGSQYDKGGNK